MGLWSRLTGKQTTVYVLERTRPYRQEVAVDEGAAIKVVSNISKSRLDPGSKLDAFDQIRSDTQNLSPASKLRVADEIDIQVHYACAEMGQISRAEAVRYEAEMRAWMATNR